MSRSCLQTAAVLVAAAFFAGCGSPDPHLSGVDKLIPPPTITVRWAADGSRPGSAVVEVDGLGWKDDAGVRPAGEYERVLSVYAGLYEENGPTAGLPPMIGAYSA